MTSTQNLLLWGPRIAGIVVAAFLALFAMDAFNERSGVSALPDFAIHLIPSLLVLAVVAVAWRYQWIGAIAFIGLAVLYAMMVRGRLDWIVAISGPLLLVGVLFLVSWHHHADLHAGR
ncbi:MAG TPA: hypothetical protein VFT39_05405 [Vicinamibacterales bacterium]|nr:hypothetical protein [Vicinamibacterales bacterium]